MRVDADDRAPPSSNTRRDFALILVIGAIGFVLRLVAVAQYQASHPNASSVVIDEKSYDRWARAIAAGDWMGREVFFQEPLYPYALGSLYAVVGESLHAARIAHCVLWAATIVFVGLLARRLFGRAAGFTAAILVALHGPALIFPSLILKENLFLPVLSGLALLVVRSRSLAGNRARIAWLAIGILGGLGALLRGNVLVLLPVLAAWPFLRKRFQRERVAPAFSHAAAFVLGVACVLGPVAWRNAHVGGAFVLTTSGAGTNVYGGNNAENPYGRATEFSFVRGIPEFEAGDWKHEAERRSGRELAANEVSSYWMGEALRSMREQPLLHARILWNKLRLSLGRYEVPDNHMLDWDARYVAIARLPWPDFGVTGALGLAGVLAWTVLALARRRAPAGCTGGATEIAILFALYLGTIVLTVTSDRARLPLLVLLAPFAAFTCVQGVAWIRARRRFEIGVLASALFVALLFAYVPALPASDREEDYDERDFNLSVQWLDQPGREADGRRLVETLIAKHPRTARVNLLLLTYDHRRASRLLAEPEGPSREAGQAQLRAVQVRAAKIADDASVFPRERFRANALTAWAALELRDVEEAARRFALARAFDPKDPELRGGDVRAELAGMNRTFLEDVRPQYRDPSGIRADGLEAGVKLLEPMLDRLQVLALDRELAPDVRSLARGFAGWIQLDLGRPEIAVRHFRAAHQLAPTNGTRNALTVALTALAKGMSAGVERDAVVREALALIREGPPGSASELERELHAVGGG